MRIVEKTEKTIWKTSPLNLPDQSAKKTDNESLNVPPGFSELALLCRELVYTVLF
jgi:hypothetical protein